jgi:hypothetical protein
MENNINITFIRDNKDSNQESEIFKINDFTLNTPFEVFTSNIEKILE